MLYKCSKSDGHVPFGFISHDSLKLPGVCLLGAGSPSGDSRALRGQREIDKVVWQFMLCAYIAGEKLGSGRQDYFDKNLFPDTIRNLLILL